MFIMLDIVNTKINIKFKSLLRLDALMLSVLDKEKLTAKQQKNKLEVIRILGRFLKQSNAKGLIVPTWDREIIGKGFSWLGWTVVNGTADDIAALIESKQPFDPLLGRLSCHMFTLNDKYEP